MNDLEIKKYWNSFKNSYPEYVSYDQPVSFYFCDNKEDADECADLVVNRVKRATSPSVWSIKKNKEKFPEIGDIAIVTDWEGNPKAIIKTIKVDIVKFKDISPEYAFLEGEGDKSLVYWRAVHLEYYSNEMRAFGELPDDNMDIICEQFERIW